MNRHATVEQLSAYIDEELVEREQERLERHLEGCTACRDRLAGLHTAARRLGMLSSAQPPRPLQGRVQRAVQGVSVGGRLLERLEAGVRGRLTQPVFAPAFAVVLALAAIIYLFSLGVAREQRAATRVVLPRSAPQEGETRTQAGGLAATLMESAPPAAVPGEPEAVRIGERWFDRRGERWVERGLEGAVPEKSFTVAAGEPTEIYGLSAEETAALAPLDRLVLRVEGRVTELVFEP